MVLLWTANKAVDPLKKSIAVEEYITYGKATTVGEHDWNWKSVVPLMGLFKQKKPPLLPSVP